MKSIPWLLKAQDIDKMSGKTKTHFLNPNAVRLSKSLGDAVGLKHLGVHRVELEPGREATEYHMHWHEEECVFVLAGSGEAMINGEVFPLGCGDFIGLPAGQAAHSVVNTGSEILVLLVFGQRLPQDVADYPQQRKRIYRHAAGWDLVDMDAIESIQPTLPRGSDD